MSGLELAVLISLPLAFLHGYFSGRSVGVSLGASQAYDYLYKIGTPTETKGVRTIELRNDDETA